MWYSRYFFFVSFLFSFFFVCRLEKKQKEDIKHFGQKLKFFYVQFRTDFACTKEKRKIAIKKKRNKAQQWEMKSMKKKCSTKQTSNSNVKSNFWCARLWKYSTIIASNDVLSTVPSVPPVTKIKRVRRIERKEMAKYVLAFVDKY